MTKCREDREMDAPNIFRCGVRLGLVLEIAGYLKRWPDNSEGIHVIQKNIDGT